MRLYQAILGLLLATGTLVLPSASAADFTVNCRILPCPDVSVGDRDGDGFQEAHAEGEFGGPCGCACPVTGAFAEATVAGQKVFAEAVTVVVFCGNLVIADADPNTVNPKDNGVKFGLILWPDFVVFE